MLREVNSRFPCEKNNCQGPYTLEREQSMAQSHRAFLNVCKVTKITNKVNVMIIEKFRFRKYCYNGGSMDPNTGCKGGMMGIQATQDEINRKGCYIGEVPQEIDGFWGSWAEKCMAPETAFVTDKTMIYSSFDGKAPFAHHLCVQDWKCKVHHSEFPVFYNSSNKIMTLGRKGKPIDLGYLIEESKNVTKNGLKTTIRYKEIEKTITEEDGFTAVLRIQPEATMIGTHCHCFLGKMSKKKVCSITENFGVETELSGHVFEYNGPENIDGSTLIEVSGLNAEDKVRIGMSDGVPSMEDLEKLAQEVNYIEEETHYNTEVLSMRINNLNRLLRLMINSLGKLDDELIPNIIRAKAKTVWKTEEIFELCSCFQPKFEEGENCANGFIFENGRTKHAEESDKWKCAKTNVEKINKIKIDNSSDLIFTEILFEPPMGSARFWDGWTWVSSEKESVIDSSVFYKDVISDNRTVISQIASISPFDFWSHFNFIFGSSFVSYLALAVSLYSVLSRKR